MINGWVTDIVARIADMNKAPRHRESDADCAEDSWFHVSCSRVMPENGDGNRFLLIFDSITSEVTVDICALRMDVFDRADFDRADLDFDAVPEYAVDGPCKYIKAVSK